METTIKEFKGTKGDLELKFVGPICIGIGTVGDYSQITANSILPETDKEYEAEKEEIEANMQLYASSLKLLEALQTLISNKDEILSHLNFCREGLEDEYEWMFDLGESAISCALGEKQPNETTIKAIEEAN